MEAAPHNIQTERFEADQYVRVQLSTGRSEIGVVLSIDETDGTAVIATRHGYDITVRLRSVRRAFLLVLDLNGVLVSRGRGSFVDRPGVAEFIKFVMNNFVVAVWTSGLERTSNPIIDKVLDGFQDRLLFRLYRDSCTMWPTPEKPYRTIKDLQRIFDAYPKSFHAVNTIIVDDSPDKCSHPDIALCPVPFNDPVKQVDDNGLALAMEVLKEVLRTESLAPLIRASEERLVALAAQEERRKQEAAAAESTPAGAQSPGNATSATSAELPSTLLWATRLCCDHINGGCAREDCRFSHGVDDGKQPCSRKGWCRRGHAHRWTEVPPLAEAKTPPRTAAVKTLGTSAPFNVSNIASLFSTNPDQQRDQLQSSNAHSQQGWSKHNDPQQPQPQPQQPQPQPQQQQQQQQRQQKPQRNRRQKETKGAERQRDRSDSSLGKKETNRGMPNVAQSSGSLRGAPQDAVAVGSVAPGSTSMRFTGDREDGNALLRRLQESLLVAKGEGTANGGTNRGKGKRR
ncbi:uncharacterized protein Tco025E_05819 [Trypanosoma conorhini]|uniref:Mitochondrial import inner membrane translocase subunit TIM50 n=1 Tax=Trypanosoma conorhini TaxID=83891 RepID=A0A422P9U5_9TRYP|nr:uncharacterized protein Tco025E_05819 [Trypanosoma conorhini]RNF14487.1 hypothetical protein Tco025E_05819 [Trypanosoma conorhini]